MTAKLVRSFTIQLRSARSKVPCASSSSFSDVQKLLEEGQAGPKHSSSAEGKKHVIAFLWVERKTQARARVEDEDAFQRFVTEMRNKLVDELTSEQAEQLRELSKDKERLGELDDKKEEQLTKLLTTEQEVITILGEAVDSSGGGAGEAEYDPEKLRRERLQRIADEEERTRGKERAKDPGETVKYMTLRFPGEKEEGDKGKVIEVTNLPYSAAWEEACQALTRRFERVVHFRYQTDKKTWRDVRSPEAFARFRQEMGAEWAQQGAVTGVAEVQLLSFGTGVLPAVQHIDDASVLSFTHDVIREQMKVMPLVAKCQTDEEGAAAQARELMQSKERPSKPEADDLGRTPLHLAAMSGHHKLAEALLSAPSTVRAEMVAAKDLLGRTPLHYAKDDNTCKALLQGKADPRLVDNAGCTPLHTVTDADAAMTMLRGRKAGGLADATVNTQDRAGLSPLLAHAQHTDRTEMLRLLAERASGLVNTDEHPVQVDMRAEDRSGRTALHHAASSNNYIGIQILVKTGQVDINKKDAYGMTPLHIAAANDHIKTVSYLVGQLADTGIRDAAGRRPADLAQSKGTKRLLENSTQALRARTQ